MVCLEQVAPSHVAQLGCSLGGPDDVREQHCGQHSVVLGVPADAGQELLDLADDSVRVTDPRQVVLAGHLNEARAGDVFGEVAPGRDRECPVASAVQDQRWNADRFEDGSNVDLGVHPGEREHGGRAGAQAQVARPG